jgi:DNA-binding CsgD family transcriptional regulator
MIKNNAVLVERGLMEESRKMGGEHRGFAGRLRTSFAGLWRGQEILNLHSIRWNRSFYFLAYALELLFYAYHNTALHTDSTLFGISPSMLMYIGHILMSLVIMLLWSERFRHLIYISIAVALAGFVAFLAIPDGVPRLVCAVITMAGIGGCVTSARCGFAFAANNTERLLGVVAALGVRAVLNFVDAILPDDSFWDNALFMYVFPCLLLGGLVVCLLCFRESDLEVKEHTTPDDSRGLYLGLAVFICFFAIEGYFDFLENADFANEPLFSGIGKLVAVSLFVSVLLLLKKNIWHIWNLFFGICIITALIANFVPGTAADAPICFLLGVADIGWIGALYMLAGAQRRFASYRLLKQCTVVFVILSPITTLSDELVEMLFPEYLAPITLVYILVITIAFLMASPYTHKYLFGTKWLGDLQKQDMALWNDKIEEADRFEGYGLSPREKEVLALLLSAYTLRMIAGHLGISQGTVNTYAASLYRKIGVNSKTELFLKFGVTDTSSRE